MKHEDLSLRRRAPGLIWAVLAALCLRAAPVLAQQPPLPTITLGAGIFLIHAEVADTPATRELGLMRRRAMAQEAGMLFVFDRPASQCMWMKNTLIPLSVAFIDDGGKIINVAEMQPLTETSHCAARPARFALEMNQGWFKKRGILVGSKIQGLARFLPAKR